MSKFFIVIDMQNDFCTTGPLRNAAAVAVIPRIKTELEKAKAEGAKIIFTRDTHFEDTYETSGEGKHLPHKHCIKDTEGWQIVPELDTTGAGIIDKLHFGYAGWDKIIAPGDEVTMVGTCTDICVVSNALAIKMIENVEVNIIADCCAGLSPEKHDAALEVMASCQCNII